MESGADDFINKSESLTCLEGRIKMLIKKYMTTRTHSWLADLAGSNAADHAVRHALNSGRRFAILYLDLDGMTQLNELFGFEAGDRVLWQLARILVREVRDRNLGDLIGYYGQDDFIVLTDINRAENLAGEILARFEESFHGWADNTAAGLEFPTLSIGIAQVSDGRSIHIAQVNHLGNVLKRQAKAVPGSTIQIGRIN
jgi:diguanylate cyclase (GGDEF)-like protein